MSENKGTICLIQTEEFISTNKYQISCISGRLPVYKKKVRYLCVMECKQPFDLKKKIKDKFASRYRLITSKEDCFEGFENDMLNDFLNITQKHNNQIFNSELCDKMSHCCDIMVDFLNNEIKNKKLNTKEPKTINLLNEKFTNVILSAIYGDNYLKDEESINKYMNSDIVDYCAKMVMAGISLKNKDDPQDELTNFNFRQKYIDMEETLYLIQSTSIIIEAITATIMEPEDRAKLQKIVTEYHSKNKNNYDKNVKNYDELVDYLEDAKSKISEDIINIIQIYNTENNINIDIATYCKCIDNIKDIPVDEVIDRLF